MSQNSNGQKTQANSKQHPEEEPLLLENCSYYSCCQAKITRHILTNKRKNRCA